jgi:hypothetical protein
MGNRLILALLVAAAFLLPDSAQAQCSGQPGANTFCAGPASGGGGLPGWRALVGADLPTPLSAPIIVNSTVIQGGTAGRTPYNNAGTYGEFVMGGDCTLAVPSITCTKTGGAAFAASATLDTTNANNIGSGTLANTRLATGFVNAGTGLTGGALAGGGSVGADIASVGNFEAGTANKLLAADKVFTAEIPIAFSATPTFDFSTFLNASITLTANITSTTFSNMKAGQAGIIRFIQDGTGSRTIPVTLNSNLKCAGGCNFVLSTAANSVDALSYQCVATNYCLAALLKAMQ